MIRVMIIKEDGDKRIMFLYGGQSQTECLKDIEDFVSSDKDVKCLHFENENKLLDGLLQLKQ